MVLFSLLAEGITVVSYFSTHFGEGIDGAKDNTRIFLALMIKIILLPVTLEQWTKFAFFFFLYQNLKSFLLNPSEIKKI